MLRPLLIALLLSIAVPTVLHAQGFLHGTVKDAKDEALPGATILLQKDSSTIGYTISDNDGQYKLHVSGTGSYMLQVASLGFTIQYKSFHSDDVDKSLKFDFVLEEKALILGAVEVISEQEGLVSRNDSIIYDVGKYASGEELSLSDLLKKIPGISVENGSVHVNGQKVDKLLINGRGFPLAKHDLVTTGIKADMVDELIFLEDYQPDALLAGFESAQTTALQIGIKKEYVGALSGDLSLAGGIEDKWQSDSRLLRFGSKSNLYVLGSMNNTGEQLLDFNDYINLVGVESFSKSDDNFGTHNKAIGRLLLPDKQVAARQSGLGLISYTLSAKDAPFELQSYVLYHYQEQQKNAYLYRSLLGQACCNQVDEIRSQQDLMSHLTTAFVRARLKLGEKSMLRYQISVQPDQSDASTNDLFEGSRNNDYFQRNTESALQLHQTAQLDLRLNQKLLWYVSVQHRIHRSNRSMRLLDQSGGSLPFFASSSSVTSEGMRNDKISSTQTGLRWQAGHLLVNLETGYSYQQTDRDLDTRDESLALLRDYSGNQNTGFHRLHGTVNARLKVGAIEVKAGGKLLHWRSLIMPEQGDGSRVLVYPQASFSWKIRQAHELRLYYNHEQELPGGDLLVPFGEIINYQQEVQGSLGLVDRSTNSSLGLFYFNHDVIRGIHIFGNLMRTQSNRWQGVDIVNNEIYSTQVRRLLPDRTQTTGNLMVNKSLKGLPLMLAWKSSLLHSTANASFGGSLQESRNTRLLSDLHIRTSWKKQVQFKAGFRWQQQANTIAELSNRVTHHQPYTGLIIGKSTGWYFRTESFFNTYKGSRTNQDFVQLDAQLAWQQKEQAWRFSLRAVNLLNINNAQSINSTLSPVLLEESITNILPGYLLLGISYRF